MLEDPLLYRDPVHVYIVLKAYLTVFFVNGKCCCLPPAAVREADSLYSFMHELKTHLFTLCFND